MKFHRNSQCGFSLLEVLVAFTILSLGLAVILQIFGRGNQTSQLTREYAIAAEIAESRLAQLAEYELMDVKSTSGLEMDRYEWSLTLLPYEEEDITTTPENLALYSVRVDVNWLSLGKTRHIFLESIRLLPVSTG